MSEPGRSAAENVMDTTGKIYIAIGILVLIGMIVVFWFISKRCPRGVLLGVGIGLWLLGKAICCSSFSLSAAPSFPAQRMSMEMRS
jgi:hypothetical protein